MKIKDMKISTQLKIGISVTILLVVCLGSIAWVQTNVLWRNTKWLYDHPLQVRRAISVFEADIMGMRMEIRNAILLNTAQGVQTALKNSAVHQANAQRQFTILFEKYLGPRSDIEDVQNTFVSWISSRNSNWALLRDGKIAVALSRIYDTGDLGSQRALLLEQIKKIDDFATAKADDLYLDATQLNDSLSMQLILLVGFIIFLTSGVGYLLILGIKKPLKELSELTQRFRKGDFSARSQNLSANELGELSTSFNEMADAISLRIETEKKSTAMAKTLIVETGLKEFAGTVLETFMDITESNMGAFYSRKVDESCFSPLASLGINSEFLESFDASFFEGQFGKSLKTGKASHIRNIPEETVFTFKTFAGTALPKEIITLPVMVGGKVRGMLALACLGAYSKAALSVLTQSSVIALNTAFANLLANDRTRRLSEELRENNQELQAQQEELHSQAQVLRKQSEEFQAQNTQLEQQQLIVEEASRLKSQFLSNMSHELRTPLNSVMALSRVLMMQAKTKLSSEEIGYLAIIERNGKNLLTLINDILDLSKIEAGRMDIKPRLFSLAQSIDNTVESIVPLALEKHVKIRQKIPDNLPLLESDEIRVTQILQNLIANAVKFTSEGSVTVSVKNDKDKFLIQIADTGIGIAESDLSTIFDEFRQVDGSSSRRHEGTGLGLTIVHKVARMLGGEISVTSNLGVGSIFTLILPHTFQGGVSDYEPIAVSRPVGEKPVLKTILVVDDELQTADMISRYLIQEGYHTIIATSGEEAMTLASRQIPFAIILDIVMPDMDGWEVLQGLKKNPDTRNIPVIIVSIAEDRETGFALGAIGYVTKPVFKKRLISEIQKVNWPDTRSIMIVDDNDIDRREMGREHSPKSKRAETSTGLPRILLVEDNEAAIIQVRSILESSGYVVDVSRGGQEAIDYVSHTVPDGIVLDLMMPEIDGFEVLEKIRGRSDTAKIPVLILTAKNLTPEDFKKLSANNVQQLVQKGDVGRESLLLKISSMLEKETKADAGKPKPDTKKMSPIAGTSQKTTLLIVEDNPDNMITIKAVLQHRFGIIEACDGEEGLQMAAEKRPDLILLDMALPKVDGITVVQHLKNDRELNHIPVIAMTAKVMKGDREEILGAGCDDYIAKPIDPVDFFEKITQWLKR